MAVNRSSKFPPTRQELYYFNEIDGKYHPVADKDGAINVKNAFSKVRDSFEVINTDLWEISTGSGDIVEIGGNTAGSKYLKISKSIDQEDTETVLLSKFTIDCPVRLGLAMSLSQRLAHQRFSFELVGVDEQGNIVSEIPVSTPIAISSLSQSSTTLTVTTATSHGFVPGDRVAIYGASDSRFNYGEVYVATVTSPTVFTVTATPFATIPSLTASVNSTGFVVKVDPHLRANDAFGVFWEGTSANNAKLISRSNKSPVYNSSDTSLGSNHTNATVANSNGFADAFNPSYIYDIRYKQEGVIVRTLPLDSTSGQGGIMRRSQAYPDSTKTFKIRIRARNNLGLSKPVARIVNAVKSGSTTATITTDVPHGLTTGDQIMIYGNRDQTNFANLSTATAVASVIDAYNFTIAYGASYTGNTRGGVVIKINGSYGIAPSAQTVQSIQQTAGLMTVVGSGNWSGFSIGETIELRGLVDSTTGTVYTQYEGAYKVANINNTTLTLYAPSLPDFGLINCGGAVIKRTDLRLHFFRVLDYTRQTVEVDGGIGNYSDYQEALGVNIINAPNINGGQTAHDSPATGNPLRIGGKAATTLPTTISNGDAIDIIATLGGLLVNKPFSVPEMDWQYVGTINNSSADVALKSANASFRNYVTGISIYNSHTAAVEVVIKDGSTVIWRILVPAGQAFATTFLTPLKGTVNTAMNVATPTAVNANVYISAQGFQSL